MPRLPSDHEHRGRVRSLVLGFDHSPAEAESTSLADWQLLRRRNDLVPALRAGALPPLADSTEAGSIHPFVERAKAVIPDHLGRLDLPFRYPTAELIALLCPSWEAARRGGLPAIDAFRVVIRREPDPVRWKPSVVKLVPMPGATWYEASAAFGGTATTVGLVLLTLLVVILRGEPCPGSWRPRPRLLALRFSASMGRTVGTSIVLAIGL